MTFNNLDGQRRSILELLPLQHAVKEGITPTTKTYC